MVANQDRLGTVRPVGGAGAGADAIRLETETPGFVTAYIRGYFSPSDGLSFTYGVENLFDRNYYEHLNLRLPAQTFPQPAPPGAQDFAPTIVYSPGITPYFGVEVEY
jgi:outer membrane receptor protein involved in Fe transport